MTFTVFQLVTVGRGTCTFQLGSNLWVLEFDPNVLGTSEMSLLGFKLDCIS